MAPSDRNHPVTSAASRNAGPVPFNRTTAPRRMMGFSQADTRRGVRLTDQHGRQWAAQIENKSGMPTGLISNSFEAPWLPAQKDLVVNPENPANLWIDYSAMFTERQEALNQYHDHAVELAADKSWPIPVRGKYSSDIRRILRKAPLPLEPVLAAMQENPWILGRTKVEDPRLVEFVREHHVLTPEEANSGEYGPESYAKATKGSGSEGEELDALIEPSMSDDSWGQAGVMLSPSGETGYEAREAPARPEVDGAREIPGCLCLQAAGDNPACPRHVFAFEESEDDLLEALGTGADPEALAGRNIPPPAMDRAVRQAPRRPAQTSVMKKKAASRGSAKNSQTRREQGDTRRSLADGATPAVSSGGLDDL